MTPPLLRLSPRLLRQSLTLGALLLIALASSGRDPGACGPVEPYAVFAYDKHPDFPLEGFAGGQLGVLRQSYARSYLAVAYRQMSGLAVGDAEATALTGLWRERLGLGDAASGTPPIVMGDGTPTASEETIWRDAVAAVTGARPTRAYATDRQLPGESYQWYRNLMDDAFRQATETLKARADAYGKESPLLRDWLRAQELVFTSGTDSPNGAGGTGRARGASSASSAGGRSDAGGPAGLTPLPADAPSLARADRQYQIAAARFYSGEFAAAREAFQAIAKDQASPWHPWGRYLAARCLLRQATVDGPPTQAEPLLRQAIEELTAIAAEDTAPRVGDAVTEQSGAPRTRTGAATAGRTDAADGGPKAHASPAGRIRASSRALVEWARYQVDALATARGSLQPLEAAGERVLGPSSSSGEALATGVDHLTRLLDRRGAVANPDDAAAGRMPAGGPAGGLVEASNATPAAGAAAEAGAQTGAGSGADSAVRPARDLIDWLLIFQQGAPDRDTDDASAQTMRDRAAEAAVTRWRASQTMPWLVAALTLSSATGGGIDELLAAAGQASPDSPAYATVAYHHARLLLERRDLPGARGVLDRAIARADQPQASSSMSTAAPSDSVPAGPKPGGSVTGGPVANSSTKGGTATRDSTARGSVTGDSAGGGAARGGIPLSAVNDLRALRLRTARSLGEFLDDAARPSVATVWSDDGNQVEAAGEDGPRAVKALAQRLTGQRLFDEDAAALVNRLPLAQLVGAAESTALPATLRTELALAAWTRALRLDDREHGLRAAALVRPLVPVLAPDLNAYTAARTPLDQRVAGLWALLRHPGLSGMIQPGVGRLSAVGQRDIFRNNWWCAGVSASDAADSYAQAPRAAGGAVPAFLSDAERATAAAELDRLEPAGSTYLPRETVRWATDGPDDGRLPQALHLAVLATRYGCTDGETGAASQAAFNLLHMRFPSSPWAARTPYWYR